VATEALAEVEAVEVVQNKALLMLSVQAVLVVAEPSFFTTRIMENN
jgi:hypothetical protein